MGTVAYIWQQSREAIKKIRSSQEQHQLPGSSKFRILSQLLSSRAGKNDQVARPGQASVSGGSAMAPASGHRRAFVGHHGVLPALLEGDAPVRGLDDDVGRPVGLAGCRSKETTGIEPTG